jgi:hypothetical protein
MSDPVLEHLAVKADRRRLLTRVKADEDRFSVAPPNVATRCGVSPASMTWTSTRSPTRGEQGSKGLIEGHEPVRACLLPQPGGFEGFLAGIE